MSDLGALAYFLGIEFARIKAWILMHQRKYISDVLGRFEMLECNPASTPVESGHNLSTQSSDEQLIESTSYRQVIGSLRYICNTRPDLTFGVGLVSRFMEKPAHSHMQAVKRILRYLKGSLDFGVLLPTSSGQENHSIYGYSDADWSGDKDDRKSTSGYLFKLGEASISWCSRKQNSVALSSYEVEYVSACLGAQQALWLQALGTELGVQNDGELVLFVDNKSTINLAKNPISHGRSKHIETKYHFLRDQVEKGKLSMEFCRSEDQQADILTKALKRDLFQKQRKQLSVISLACMNYEGMLM
ncbi:unnamed protein product [Lupinus luteus]|uniref:Uncharacterized protein n=1 Tax=Lupinus luteus TaxID=3873 RepID=A0AAV1X4D7_LUPLU